LSVLVLVAVLLMVAVAVLALKSLLPVIQHKVFLQQVTR
jgi:hypothetical protein